MQAVRASSFVIFDIGGSVRRKMNDFSWEHAAAACPLPSRFLTRRGFCDVRHGLCGEVCMASRLRVLVSTQRNTNSR